MHTHTHTQTQTHTHTDTHTHIGHVHIYTIGKCLHTSICRVDNSQTSHRFESATHFQQFTNYGWRKPHNVGIVQSASNIQVIIIYSKRKLVMKQMGSGSTNGSVE